MRRRNVMAGIGWVALAAALPAAAQDKPAPAAAAAKPAAPPALDKALAARVEALGRMHYAVAPSLSPDGTQVAFLSNASGSPQVWIAQAAGGAPKQVTNLPDPVGDVYWSPKGDAIAYTVAPGGGLNTQIWIARSDGSDARRLTAGGKDNNGLAGWTRDGARLMVDTNKTNPAARDAALIDVASNRWTMLSNNKGLTGLSDVRGTRAVMGRLVGRGDSNAYLVDLASGKETLLTPHTGKAEVSWGQLSPDGRTVFLLANLGRDREAFGTVALGADGTPGPIRYFAARDDAVADAALLSDDGRTAALLWNAGGRSELVLRDVKTGKQRPVALPLDIVALGAFSQDGKALAVHGASADRTTDVYLVDVASGAVRRVTESRHDGVDLATLVRPELVDYAAPDGVKLSGWLYRPKGASGPLPTVFSYHGGPEGQARPTLSSDAQALVAAGIQVFAPNVRGSSGYGKAFMALDDGAKRVGSVADIKASTDALVGKGLADPKRLGIIGGSYGGYMVMAGVTEYPTMFAAGADLFGIVNFESFFRETEPWMAAISTTEYGDPATQADMLRKLSPIHKLDRITTPLFVLHGANDTNVPVVEAEQIVASLKKRGVEVKYLLFPDEGHGWRKVVNRVRSTVEVTAFFKQHLAPAKVAAAR
jgi:dipeptidyl aminopeptidase/acylaminoacyl peptidase